MVDLEEKTRLCSVCYKMCRDVCSVAGATRHEADSPHNRGFFAQQVLEGAQKLDGPVVDYFYRCSMCKACREACETGMDTSEIMLAARTDLADDLLPEKVRKAEQAVVSGTYWGGDSPQVKKLLSGRTYAGSGVLFYFGRRLRAGTGDYIKSALGVMDKLGIVGGVAAEEPSTGQIAHFLGFSGGARDLGRTFAAAVKNTGASSVVIFCADDLRMIIKEYPALGIEMPGVEFVSLPELLKKTLSEKGITLKKWNNGAVTYHDPCALGRELRVFEAPREIIRSAAAADFREMALTKDKAPCCGWGMGLEISHPELSRIMAERLGFMTTDVGAETLITGCPTCREVIAAAGGNVIDLVQFIERVLP